MMLRATLFASAMLWSLPASAQDHSAHQPDPQPAQDHTDHSAHQPAQTAPAPFKLPDMTQPMDHSAHQVDTVPSGPPPNAAFEGPEHAADAIFGTEAMEAARAQGRATHGSANFSTLMLERFEARIADGHDAWLWDAQAWYGRDIDKFVLKSEGEGEFGGAIDDAEVQALWGHAIGPWFDLQAGVLLDLEPEMRSHLALGVQGLAPYMFHIDATAFLSDRSDLTAEIEGEYDQKITQRLVLQPRAELALSAQDIPERETGAGLTKLEAGLRLRYEIAREFAPYIGVEYEAKLGETADIAKAAGDDPDGLALVFGLRAWF